MNVELHLQLMVRENIPIHTFWKRTVNVPEQWNGPVLRLAPNIETGTGTLVWDDRRDQLITRYLFVFNIVQTEDPAMLYEYLRTEWQPNTEREH